MNTTELVVKIRPEKNSGPYGAAQLPNELTGSLLFFKKKTI